MKYLNEMTDEELALAYVEGDNRAFDEVLDRNKTKLFSYIFFVVRNRDVAEDLFQETFVKVICRLQEGRYTDSGKFSAWVMRIAHNAIMDWYRSQRTSKIVETDADNNLSKLSDGDVFERNCEDDYVYNQTISDVKNMVSHLPASQREIIFMRYYQRMSFKEIAELTNVSINTALGRMRYAILNLRRMVKKHNIELVY
jgi:RNA polymerase sigma factor (sigma-70 family)